MLSRTETGLLEEALCPNDYLSVSSTGKRLPSVAISEKSMRWSRSLNEASWTLVRPERAAASVSSLLRAADN